MRSQLKDKTFAPIIEKEYNSKNVCLIRLVRNQEIVRTIHITFKKALVLSEGQIKTIWMVEYTKENYRTVENPYACTIPKLYKDLGMWVASTNLHYIDESYNLNEQESECVVNAIIFYHFPFLSSSSLDNNCAFIKWL